MELYRDISEYSSSKKLKMKDFSTFICDNIILFDESHEIIQTRKVPIQSQSPNKLRIREIDLDAPLLIGKNEDSIRRLNQIVVTDSIRHYNSAIAQGVYCDHIQRVFTLDQLSTSLSLYDLKCNLDKRLVPRTEKETVILDFAWSKKQQRLGLTLKDYTLCFFDSCDNFSFQKRINISLFVQDFQSQIWFLDIQNCWITTDKTYALNIWDLEEEEISKKFHFKSGIVALEEIVHLRLVGIACQEKKIHIFDFNVEEIKISIDLQNGGVHSIVYSYEFQVLLSLGYENKVNIFQIHSSLCDYDLKGCLIGHASMVTAVQVVKKTALVVTADDNGSIRLWDIRTLRCVQQLNIGNKSKITKILDISNRGFLGFIGCRLNMLDFSRNNRGSSVEDQEIIIRAEFDSVENILIICTRKDIRLISISTGRVIKIFNSLLENPDDDITYFRTLNQFRNFIVADVRGRVWIYRFQNFEISAKLQAHQNEIICLKVDTDNNLLTSAAIDNQIIIRQLKSPFTIIKEIKNIGLGKKINLIDISVHHNLLVVSASGSELGIYDYENGRLMSVIDISYQNQREEPTSFLFINGFSLLCISTNFGLTYILKFFIKDQISVYYDIIGVLQLDERTQPPQEKQSKNKDLFQLTQEMKIQQGLDLGKLQQKWNENQSGDYVVKNLIDIEITQNQMVHKCLAYYGTCEGRVLSADLMPLIEACGLKYIPHASQKLNYNPYKKNKEDFSRVREKLGTANDFRQQLIKNFRSMFLLNPLVQLDIQAHKDTITNLSLIENEQWCLITCATDNLLKIWTVSGNLQAQLNINDPLPIVWNFKYKNRQKFKRQFQYAIKILNQINYNNKQMDQKLDQSIQQLLQRFYQKKNVLIQDDQVNEYDQEQEEQSSGQNETNKIIVMKDEYQPFEITKPNIAKPIQTNTLKAMEINKKLKEIQDYWKNDLKEQARYEQVVQRSLEAKRQMQQERDFNVNFLFDDYRQKIIDSKNEDGLLGSVFMNYFSKKLDQNISIQDRQIKGRKETIYTQQYQSNRFDQNSLNISKSHQYSVNKSVKQRPQDLFYYAKKKKVFSSLNSINQTTLNSSRTQQFINLDQSKEKKGNSNAQKELVHIILKNLNQKLKKSQSHQTVNYDLKTTDRINQDQSIFSKNDQTDIKPKSQTVKLPSINNDKIKRKVNSTTLQVQELLRKASNDAASKIHQRNLSHTLSVINKTEETDQTNFNLMF